MSKPYYIPLTEIRREHLVINSRFIATLAPVFSTEEARTFIARIKKEFAECFIRTLKEWLADKDWQSDKELLEFMHFF